MRKLGVLLLKKGFGYLDRGPGGSQKETNFKPASITAQKRGGVEEYLIAYVRGRNGWPEAISLPEIAGDLFQENPSLRKHRGYEGI